MKKMFSIKHNKLFAIIIAFCFLIPIILSGCSFGENPSEGDIPPTETTPTLTIVTDEQLFYSEANSRYEITIAQGESYTLNVNLGDYTGDEYSIVYSWNSSGNNYASIENKVISINSHAPTYANPQLTIKLQKNGSTKAIETKKIYITITERAFVSLGANSSEVEVKKSNQYGVDYELKVPLAHRFYQMPTVIVDGYEEYDVFYQNSDDEYDKDKIEFKVDEGK